MPKIATKNKRDKVVITPQCAVPLCRAKKTPYHPFPKDDEQLFQIWKSCISRNRFRLVTDEEIRSKFSICDDHFAKNCKIPGTQTLKKYSIPTLNVQGFKNNSNINVAYKLYIEKQEKEPDNLSVKNILDNNIDDDCIFIDSSSKTKSDIIWVESGIESEKEDLSPLENIIDPLITDSDIQNELINDSDTCIINNVNMKKDIKKRKSHHSETVSIINEVIPVIKNVINKYSGPNKVIRKPMKSNQTGLKSHIKCSVPNCENRYGSFHKFPTDPELSKTWKNVLGIMGPIKDHMKICSNHFKSSDYFVRFVYGPVKLENEKFKCSRMNLKKTAIPFKNTSDKSQKKIICAAYNCYNNNIDHKKMRFLPFPKNEKMAQIWATNANREDLLLRPNYFEKLYLCINHFEKRCLRKSDIDIIPTIFNDADCSYKPDELYSNLFMRTNIETQKRIKNNSISSKSNATMKNSLQVFINDPDKSKITYVYDEIVNESCVSSDFGKMDSSNCLYEDFVSNPGILDFKPQTTDLLFKKNYCRLCAKLCSVASLISIFDKSGHLTMYGEMIEICLPGKVHINDNLPQWMCSKCEYKLDICCSSIKDFIEADKQLRNIFNKVDKECNQKSKHEEITDLVDLTEDPIAILENLKSPTSEISIESELIEQLKIDGENVSPPKIPPEINKIIQIEQNKKYQCLKCNQLYNTKKELIHHSLEYHKTDLSKTNIVCEIVSGGTSSIIQNNKVPLTTTKVKCSKLRYECVICSSLHEKKDSLIKHSLRYHSSSSSNSKRIVCRVVQLSNLRNNHLTCLHCTEEFINIAKYRKHMKQHLKLNCDVCGKQFTRKYKLIAHARLHEAKYFSCSKCSQFFTDEMDLVKHEVAAHKQLKSDITKCSFCDEKFNTSGELLKHKKTHAKSLCNICGKLFSSSTLLKYHLEKHTDGQPHKCSICSKSFQTMVSLKRHQTIHSTEIRCMCQVCGKQFGYLSVLKSHMFSHSTHRPYICELCGAAFHRKNNLKKHISTHEKIKDNSITCTICKLEFNSRKMFMRHREEHVNEKKTFSCDICSKHFFTKFQAKVHRRVHTGETPYNCEQCGKSFRSLALVKQHKLIHMNVFPHQCNYCDRKFRRLQSLIVHRRTHTGEKPYPCPICGRAFANRSDMNKHRRNIHIFKNKPKSNQIEIEQDNQLSIENIFNEIQEEIHSTENKYMQEVQEDNSCSSNILTSFLHV